MKNKSIVHLSVLTLLLFGASSLQAQEKRQLSLSEAISLGVKNSQQLKISSAKVDEADAMLREARDRRLPDMGVSGAYLRVNNPKVDLKVKPSSTAQSGAGAASSFKINEVSYGLVNASVPLFSGFKVSAGITSAKYLAKAAEFDAQLDSNAVVDQLIEAYSALYKAESALRFVEENLKQAQSRVADFANLEKNGVIARNDLLKVQLQESNIQLSLLDAQNELKLATVQLNLMLGIDRETILATDSSWFTGSTTDGGYMAWENLAIQNRQDIQALEFRKKASEAGVKVARGDYYPSLSLNGGYVAAYIPKFLTVTNAINGGIGLKYNPSSLWKNHAKVDQAKARVAQFEAHQSLLDDEIRLEVGRAYQMFLSNQKKIEVYAKALEQSTENYKIVKNKMDNSLSTTTDLLDADVAQLQAKINYAFAKADAMVSYKKLQKTTGTLNR